VPKRIDRPIGIYVVTILVIIGYGIFPLISTYAAISASEEKVPFTLVFISFLLPTFSIGAAIWAFAGDNEGRIALLATVSLNFLWWLFLSIGDVARSETEALNAAFLAIGMIRPVTFFVVFWWYLTKKDVVAYYRRDL
jgi:hypothetical protein